MQQQDHISCDDQGALNVNYECEPPSETVVFLKELLERINLKQKIFIFPLHTLKELINYYNSVICIDKEHAL